MRMKRTAILVVSLLVASATVAFAATSWKTGSYAGKTDAKFSRGGFISRYVFPDGELHEVGRVVSIMQQAGFEVRHVESLREHYAKTLRHWVANLGAGRRRDVGPHVQRHRQRDRRRANTGGHNALAHPQASPAAGRAAAEGRDP